MSQYNFIIKYYKQLIKYYKQFDKINKIDEFIIRIFFLIHDIIYQAKKFLRKQSYANIASFLE